MESLEAQAAHILLNDQTSKKRISLELLSDSFLLQLLLSLILFLLPSLRISQSLILSPGHIILSTKVALQQLDEIDVSDNFESSNLTKVGNISDRTAGKEACSGGISVSVYL